MTFSIGFSLCFSSRFLLCSQIPVNPAEKLAIAELTVFATAPWTPAARLATLKPAELFAAAPVAEGCQRTGL